MKGYSTVLAEPPAACAGADSAAQERIRQLVESHLPLVARAVARVWLSARLGLTRDDLLSAGGYGLLLAARRFDPGRGVAFAAFAHAHIHGALMREINLAIQAAGLGPQAALMAPGDPVEPDSLPDERTPSAGACAEAAEVRQLMEYLLTPAERLVLTLYYYEELTLAEIAAVVEQTPGALVRLIRQSLAKLKKALEEKERR